MHFCPSTPCFNRSTIKSIITYSQMKKFYLFLSAIFLINSYGLQAQTDTLRLSLEEIVALAQSDAPDALLAETRVKNRYWDYQSILAFQKKSPLSYQFAISSESDSNIN